jgi:hypothetical protein
MKDCQIDLDDQNTLYLQVFENKILACVNGGLNHLIATTEIPVKLEVINKDVAKVTWGYKSFSYLGISDETITVLER